jgi:hypothetical protein
MSVCACPEGHEGSTDWYVLQLGSVDNHREGFSLVGVSYFWWGSIEMPDTVGGLGSKTA